MSVRHRLVDLYTTKTLLIFFAIYVHIHLFVALTTCVLLELNETYENTTRFLKANLLEIEQNNSPPYFYFQAIDTSVGSQKYRRFQ